MAVVTKTTQTVEITLADSDMGETVFKINNPKSDLTKAAIREHYAAILGNSADSSQPAVAANSHLFNKNGTPFVFVSKAASVTTTIRAEDL